MSYDAIPQELRDRRQWVCWRYTERDGKPTKEPVNARSRSGRHASTTDPDTWSTFTKAVQAAEAKGYDGIGFVFTKDDPYVGIDIDDGYDTPERNAIDVIEDFHSYTERSPSGKGFHIICKADPPTHQSGRRTGHIEVYQHSRFFTMTGDVFQDYRSIDHDQLVLIKYWAIWFPERPKAERPAVAWHADDTDILQKMFASKNGATIQALYDRGEGADNASEADLALCSHIAFYTQEPGQIDRIFRSSALYREKWEREDYRDMTISRALERSEFYTPPSNNGTGVTVYRSGEQIDPETGEIADSRPEIRVFNMTDRGNALRLVHHAGDRLRYVPKWGTWLVWDGMRWAPDELGAAMEVAKAVVETIYAEAEAIPDEDHAKKMRGWAIQSESAARLRDMLRLAQSDPAISVSPGALDRDPYLLNVQNGTIDLRTGHLRPHDAGDLLTKLAPVDYDPDAQCPTWDAFLDEIMARRPSLVEYLQRAAGYTLTGDVSERIMFILHGDTTTGKSTFLNTLHDLMGDYAKRSPNELLIARFGDRGIPHEVAQLVGVRFTFVSETGEFDRLDESKVKDLVSGDPLSARFLHQNLFSFVPQFKLWAGTNHKPTIRSSDNAIWRRIRLIPFDVSIPEDRIDKSLPKKFRSELSGILNWAVSGCLEWQRIGIAAPDIVREATQEYRDSMDVVGLFIHEECVTRDGSSESVAAMYSAYKEWAEANGEKPMTKKMLSMRMGERGYHVRRVGRSNTRMYHGIRLRTTMDDDGLTVPDTIEDLWSTE